MPTVKLIDPEPAIAAACRTEAEGGPTLLVLLAYAPKDESLALARKFPISTWWLRRAAEEPPAQARRSAAGHADATRFVEVGEKGEYAVVLGVYNDPRQPVRYQRVTLDSRFAPSPADVGPDGGLPGPARRRWGWPGWASGRWPPAGGPNGRFVGRRSCKDCHEESYKVWRKSAPRPGVRVAGEAEPPRNYDPECISCHVVGWNPQKFFPYQSGYLTRKDAAACERGLRGLPRAGPEARRRRGGGRQGPAGEAPQGGADHRRRGRRPHLRKQNCYSCHDLDNSPEFDFKLYFPLVEHHEEK